jgi:hypothetical protein
VRREIIKVEMKEKKNHQNIFSNINHSELKKSKDEEKKGKMKNKRENKTNAVTKGQIYIHIGNSNNNAKH